MIIWFVKSITFSIHFGFCSFLTLWGLIPKLVETLPTTSCLDELSISFFFSPMNAFPADLFEEEGHLNKLLLCNVYQRIMSRISFWKTFFRERSLTHEMPAETNRRTGGPYCSLTEALIYGGRLQRQNKEVGKVQNCDFAKKYKPELQIFINKLPLRTKFLFYFLLGIGFLARTKCWDSSDHNFHVSQKFNLSSRMRDPICRMHQTFWRTTFQRVPCGSSPTCNIRSPESDGLIISARSGGSLLFIDGIRWFPFWKKGEKDSDDQTVRRHAQLGISSAYRFWKREIGGCLHASWFFLVRIGFKLGS